MASVPDCTNTLLASFLKEGAGAEVSVELTEHAASCPSCQRELDAALALRKLVAPIGAEGMDPRRADEMRFVLMEGARVPRRTGTKRRAIAAAAVVTFAFTSLSGAMALYVASSPKVEDAPNAVRFKRLVDPTRSVRQPDPLEPFGEPTDLAAEAPEAPVEADALNPPQMTERSASRLDPDAAFVDGWRAFRGGRYRRAASVFDRLSRASSIDAARRGEVLYWAARAHEARGAQDRAAARYERSLEVAPSGWWRTNARTRLRVLTQ